MVRSITQHSGRYNFLFQRLTDGYPFQRKKEPFILFLSTLSSEFPKHSPSEGLGVARAATERAIRPLVLAPKVIIFLNYIIASHYIMKN